MTDKNGNKAKGKLPTRPGFWSGETISYRLGKDKLVDPINYDQIDKSSYQLSVGEEVFVSPAGATDPKYRTKRMLKTREMVEIPPGQFALLTTAETVNVPKDAFAFISTRSKDAKFKGLINVSGFHVDPGYSGKLIFAMFNAGPASIHVAEGDRLFAIFFADLDRTDSTEVRRKDDVFSGIEGKYVMPLTTEFLTFQGLDTKIRESKDAIDVRLQKLERDNAIMMWAAAIIVSFLIAFGVKSWTGSGTANVSDNGKGNIAAPSASNTVGG